MQNVTSVADLKARLSRILAEVKAGKEVVVTDRGRPIARIAPCSVADGGLEDLVRSGVVRPPLKALPRTFWKVSGLRDPGAKVLRALLAEREEGR